MLRGRFQPEMSLLASSVLVSSTTTQPCPAVVPVFTTSSGFGVFTSSPPLLARPRSYGFAAPKLTRVPGKFKCGYCKATWASHNVLVTEQTRKAYQGETCANCGTTVKPFWTGEFQGTVFDKVRNFKPKDNLYKYQRYKMRQK